MDNSFKELKKRVAEKILQSSAMRDTLKADFICWRTPVVGIQNILLETPPANMVRTVGGARFMSSKKHSKIVSQWKQNLIGGTEIIKDEEREWHPPKGSALFRLQRIEHEWNSKGFEYYVLVVGDNIFYLAKESGDNNSLHVIEDDKKELYFRDALENALLFESEQ